MLQLPFSQLHALFSPSKKFPHDEPAVSAPSLMAPDNRLDDLLTPREILNGDSTHENTAPLSISDSIPSQSFSTASIRPGAVDVAESIGVGLGIVGASKVELHEAAITEGGSHTVHLTPPVPHHPERDHSKKDFSAVMNLESTLSLTHASRSRRTPESRASAVVITNKTETETQLNSVFMSMAGLASQQLYVIRKDTERTHILEHGFQGGRKEEATHDLLLLLNAYAMWDASLGYCQVTLGLFVWLSGSIAVLSHSDYIQGRVSMS